MDLKLLLTTTLPQSVYSKVYGPKITD